MAAVHAAGHEVEDLRLADLRIAGCRECFACQKEFDEPACAVEDDMQAVFDKMLAADLIVWAAPVFCWSFPAQIKAAMDRCYCLFKFKTDPYKVLIEGKRLALVVTAGGDEYEGAENCVSTFEKFAQFARVKVAGRLVIAHAGQPQEVGNDPAIAARAEAFGRALASRVG
jgi:multimeric flavodoxin WrbA